MKKSKLILMRHGESVWNKKNVFTGWVDIPLSAKGVEEASLGGKKIANMPIDLVFTSALVRAQMTTFLALLEHTSGKTAVMQHEEKWAKIHSDEMKKEIIPVFETDALNERMYGDLQGLNKEETAKKHGKEQVHLWRRSYDIPPPGGESLKMTVERAIPYFEKRIMPEIVNGKNVLIVAHGNSLRGIVMYLEKLSPDQILQYEIATGEILFYEYDGKWGKIV